MNLFRLFVICLLLTNNSVAYGQSRAKNPPDISCDPERVLLLLSEQLNEVKLLDPKSQRIKLYCQAASLVWKHRQDKAREAFQSAYDWAAESVVAEDITKQQTNGNRVANAPREDMRLEVIRAIANHDKKWAQQLTDKLLEEKKAKAEKANPQHDNEMLNHAEQLLTTDQTAAIKLARLQLPIATGYSVARFLVTLAKQDRSAADAFYLEALSAIALRSVNDTMMLFTYPFAVERPIGAEWRSVGVWGAQELVPNPALQLRYLEVIFQLAANHAQRPVVTQAAPDGAYTLSPAARLFLGLSDLEPVVSTRYGPMYGKLMEAKHSLAAVITDEYMKTVRSLLQAKRVEPGSVFDRNLAGAEQEKDLGRKDTYYFNAIRDGINQEPQERLESLLIKFSNLNIRTQVSDWLYYNLAQKAMTGGRLDEAMKLAEKVEPLDLRAYLAFQLAESALAKLNDRQRASENLDAAWRIADKAEDTNEKAKALLGVAGLYLRIDRGQALTALRAAIKTINHLETPDVSSGRFTKKISGSNFAFYAQYNMPGMGLGLVFRKLGETDFETALSLARELENKSLSASAVVSLASFCLEKTPAPEAPRKKQVSQ